jgi:hypothetical protein
MITERRFFPVRVLAVAQIASVGFAVWFMFNSLRMSCSMSGSVGSAAPLAHTINSVLLLAAILFERRWRLCRSATVVVPDWYACDVVDTLKDV